MGRVIHFELPITNPKKAMKFYEEVFDWHFEQFSGMAYWLANTGEITTPGINGALTQKTGGEEAVDIDNAGDAVNAVITIDVNNLDRIMTDVPKYGGKIMTEIRAIPTVGRIVYLTDPDGNFLGAMESEMV